MANRFLSNIRINDAYTFPASDGNDGQVITTDGAGNLAFENVSPDAASVIYRDNFTGDGSTVTFDLQNSITDEDQTQIYIDGVYQEKSTYSISGTTITFTTAPILGHSVEVISISSINTGPTVLYQDNFTGNGNDTAFTLGQIIDNEIKTFIFLNGVYQFKNTYTVDGTTLTFDTAPANGVAIEVVSIASAVQSDSLEAGSVIIPVKNTHTASISKGTPVYITGNVGASERLQIAPADASNSAKMPAAGLLLTTLAVNAEGYVITGGYLRNLTTDTIDGTSTSSNDTVYVKAGGGLTMTKPTGSNLIQNIAKIARSASGNSGSLIVSSILRTNDIPNLTTGKIWVGSANNTIESGTLHLDESNNRLGINNNNPSYSLDVTGDANISSNVIVGGNLTVQGTETILNTQTVEVEDNILQLNTTQGSPDTATATTSGISIYRGNGVTQASFIFDDADDTWDLTDNLAIAGTLSANKRAVITTDGTYAYGLNINSSDQSHSRIRITNTGVGGETYSIMVGTHGVSNAGFAIRNETDSTTPLQFDTSDNATFAGDIMPAAENAHNIGSAAVRWEDLYVDDGFIRDAYIDEYIYHNGDTNTYIRFTPDTMTFRTAGDDAITIDSNRRVGIGTTLPQTLLDIHDDSPVLRISATNQSASWAVGTEIGKLEFWTTDPSGNAPYDTGFIAIENDFAGGTLPSGAMVFGTATYNASGGAVERMRIDSSGRTSIIGVFESASSEGILNLKQSSGVGSLGMGFHDTGSNPHFWLQSRSNSNYATTYNLALQPIGGSVGIGTTNPQALLHVHGSDTTYTNYGTVFLGTTAGGSTGESGISLMTSGDALAGFIGSNLRIDGSNYSQTNASRSSAYINFVNTTTAGRTSYIIFGGTVKGSVTLEERMRINDNGNVGIGETSPSYKLDINVTTTEEGIRVKAGNAYANLDIEGSRTSGNIGGIRWKTTGDSTMTAEINGIVDNGLAFRTGTGASALSTAMWIKANNQLFLYNQTSGAGNATLKYTTGTGAVTYDTSSRLVKEDIVDIPYGLNTVLALSPKKYRRIDSDNKIEIGFIADEVQEIVPELVGMMEKKIFTKNEEDTEIIAGSIEYEKMTSILVKAIQELKAEVETLKNQINGIN